MKRWTAVEVKDQLIGFLQIVLAQTALFVVQTKYGCQNCHPWAFLLLSICIFNISYTQKIAENYFSDYYSDEVSFLRCFLTSKLAGSKLCRDVEIE